MLLEGIVVGFLFIILHVAPIRILPSGMGMVGTVDLGLVYTVN